MSQDVKIRYEIAPAGEDKVRSLADGLAKLREEDAKTAEQLAHGSEAVDKLAGNLGGLLKVLESLTAKGFDLGVVKEIEQTKTAVQDVISAIQRGSSETFAPKFDDSDIRKGAEATRAFLSLLRDVENAERRSQLNLFSGSDKINLARGLRVEDINQFQGTRPDRELDELQSEAHRTADRDILTQQLRPVEQRVVGIERTNATNAQKIDEHPEQTRIASNEDLRQRLLFLAQTEEEQKRVNELVDRLNAAEGSQSALKYRLDAKAQEIEAQQRLDAIVQKSQAAELSGLQKIEAERQRILSEVGSVLPGSESVINQVYDERAAAERRQQLDQSLRPVERGSDSLEAGSTRSAEDLERLKGGEQAVLNLRKQSLEATRQTSLAEAKTSEEAAHVNAVIDRRIQAEENNAGLREQLRLRQEQIAAEEAVERLVEKTNREELTGVQRVEAERKKLLDLYGKTPQLSQQINTVFDRRAKQAQDEESEGAHGNPKRLLFAAKDLAFGYTRGALLQGVDYLTSLRRPSGAAGGTGGAAGGILGGLSELGTGGTIGLALAGTGLAIGAVSKKLIDLVAEEADAARETVNLGSRLGITATQALQLSDAARVVGVNISSVESGARLLATALEDPAGAGKKAATALNELGVSVLDTNGKAREMGPVFLGALEALSKVSNTADRLALATKLLGRGAKELEPLIQDYDQLQKIVQNAHLTDPSQLAEADKQFKELHNSWEQLKRDFATRLVPVVTPVIQGASELLSGRNQEGQSTEDRANEAEAIRQQRHPGFVSNLLHNLSPFATTVPTDEEHKAYLEAQRKRATTQTSGKQIPSDLIAQSRAEANRFLSGFQIDPEIRRAELEEQLKTAQEKQKAALNTVEIVRSSKGTANPVLPDSLASVEKDLTTASAQVTRIKAQIKALTAGPRADNRFEAERDRIAAEDYKFDHPASDFGRIPELQVQAKDTAAAYRRDLTFTPGQRDELVQDRERQSNRDIILEARRVAGNKEFQGFGEHRVDTESGLEGLRTQFASEQRLASLNADGKNETETEVEAAYQKQLQLAREIRDVHLNDLQVEKEKLAAIGDHSHDADIAKQEAEAHKQFVSEQVRAEADRAERDAAIRKRDQDEQERAAEEIGKLKTETEARFYAQQIEHAQRLAELNRSDFQSQAASVQSAYQAQLALAQLEHDTAVKENAITYVDPKKRAFEDEKALAQLTEERQKAEYDREEHLAELKKQERDEAKQQADSLFDAIRSHTTGEFFREQGNQIAKNLFSQFVGPLFQSASDKINPSGGGIRGVALKGTILGSSNGSANPAAPTTPATPGQNQQQQGFWQRLEHYFGIDGSHPQTVPATAPAAINAPGYVTHEEPLIGALDTTRDAIHDLTTAILGITPGGGVGPNPLAQNPLGSAAVPAPASAQSIPGFNELGVSSLLKSTRTTADAVTDLTAELPAAVAAHHPIVPIGEEGADEKEQLSQPAFAPNIHVQPSRLNVLSPVTGPSYATSNIYNDGGALQTTPISLPSAPEETGKTSPHGFPILGEVAAATPEALQGVFAPDTHGIKVKGTLPEQLQAPALFAAPTTPSPVAPPYQPNTHGIQVIGQAPTEPSTLGKLYEGFTDTNDVTSGPPVLKRYAYDIPNEELGKAGDAFKQGNYLQSAGHAIAAIPGTGFFSDVIGAQIQLGNRAAEEFHQGQYLNAASHELAATVPLLGPNSVSIADKLTSGKQGDGAQGVGQLAGFAAAGLLPFWGLPKILGEAAGLKPVAGALDAVKSHPLAQIASGDLPLTDALSASGIDLSGALGQLLDETGSFGPRSKASGSAGPLLYHGTSAPDFSTFDKDLAYLTSDPQEAAGFATNPITGGGRGQAAPKVYSVQAAPGKSLNIDEHIIDAFDNGDDIDDVIAKSAQEAREQNYRYLDFSHPSNYTDGDFQAKVSLYPQSDLNIVSKSTLPDGGSSATQRFINALKDDTGSFGPGSGLSKSDIAKAAAKPADAARQAAADQMEIKLSRYLGIPRTEGRLGTNAPFDLQSENVGVEVKTLFDNSNDKITMKRDALDRKLAAMQEHGLDKAYTVVADARGTKPQYYYREGLGSFRLSNLTPARNLSALKQALLDETGSFGPGSGLSTHDIAPQAFQFYSPNEAENLTFPEALSGLKSPEHQNVFDTAKQIDKALGIKGQQSDAIGDWSDGAENSIFNTIHAAPSYDAVRYSAALKGDLANQKAVIPFQVHPEGQDSLYRLTVPDVSPDDLRPALDQHGIAFRTLIPKGKAGTDVSIFDPGTQLNDNIERFADAYNVPVSQYRGHGEFLGGDTREAGHDAYHQVISDYEAQTGDRLHQRFVGHELPNAASGQSTGLPGQINFPAAGSKSSVASGDSIAAFFAALLPQLPIEGAPTSLRSLAQPSGIAPPPSIDFPLIDTTSAAHVLNTLPAPRPALPAPPEPLISQRSPHGFATLGENAELASAGALPAGIFSPQTNAYSDTASIAPALPVPIPDVPLQSAPVAPTIVLPNLPQNQSAFQIVHPTAAKWTDAFASIAPLGAAAATAKNPFVTAATAYETVGTLLKALDTRSKKTGDSRTFGNNVLNDIETVFGVRHPTNKTYGGQQQTTQYPTGPYATPPFLPPGQASAGSNPVGAINSAGNLFGGIQQLLGAFKQSGQYHRPPPIIDTAPGTTAQTNTGDILARDSSGLIIRQSPEQASEQPGNQSIYVPDVHSSASQNTSRVLNYGQTVEGGAAPQAPPYIPVRTPIPYLPQAPPYQSSLPVTPEVPIQPAVPLSDPFSIIGQPPPPYTEPTTSAGFDLVDPNSAVAHAGVINNGLNQQQVPFNSGGGQILPKSVLDAANPFNSLSSTFNTITKIGQSVAGGIGAGIGGFGGGNSGGGSREEGGGGISVDYGSLSTGNSFSDSSGGGILSGDDLANLGDFNNSELGQLDNSSAGTFPDLGTDAAVSDLFGSKGSGFLSGLGGEAGGIGSGIGGAIKGFGSGTGKGTASGISSALGTAALVDPEPISKAVLGISAAIAGIVSALLGDPRAQRLKYQTEEIEAGKTAALPYTQPGINLEESAAGGYSVNTDYLGNSRASTDKPYVYDIQEAIGFDPLHQDRVITRTVRQVGSAPESLIPQYATTAPQATTDEILKQQDPYYRSAPENISVPLASTDMTTPVQSQIPQFGQSSNSLTAQLATQAQDQNSPININFSNTWNNHSLDAVDVQRNSKKITDAVQTQLLTSHRIVKDIRDLVNVS